jgi:ketosteroid isomerase-like protein
LRRVSRANVEVVQRLFALFGEGRGIEPALEVMHPDVVIDIPPNMSAEPDTYRGHDGVRRYFAGFEGMLDEVGYEAFELIPVGDAVIACSRMSGRGASSGLDVGLDSYVVHEFADGKVVRMTPYPDLESARAALAGAN